MSYDPGAFGALSGVPVYTNGSNAMAAALDLGTHKIVNVVDPGTDQEAATKKYVDDTVAGAGGYTNEQAQDAVGTILTDTATVDFTYNDGTPSITAAVLPGGIKLDDFAAPDDNTDLNVSTSLHGLTPKITGTDGDVLTKSGTAAVWSTPASGYSDEQAQDAVGTILTDTATIDFTYTDATPAITAAVIPAGIKLDDLGTPDDNTDLNVSTSLHGLVPKITGSDGYALTKSGTAAVWSAVGGGGGTIYTSAAASPPGSPSDGDIWMPSDSVGLGYYRISSAWTARLYGSIPAVDPAVQTWAWVNQSTASIASQGGDVLTMPSAAAQNWRVRKKSAPTAPYKIDAIFQLHAYGGFSLLFRQSSDGKLAALRIAAFSGSIQYAVTKMTNATTFSADYVGFSSSFDQRFSAAGLFFLRIENDNTNRKSHISFDGQNFTQVHTIGKTDFLTADEVGWAGEPDGSNTAFATLLSWYEH